MTAKSGEAVSIVDVRLSVIVPTCHRNDSLAECLRRLGPDVQTLAADNYEVVVTDDGFRMTAEQMVHERFPWVRWVRGPRRGPAANRNNGAKAAQADYLVFCDDDCEPTPGLLDAYYRTIRVNPLISVWEGRTIADRAKATADEIAPLNPDGGLLWSCNFCTNRSFFLALGGFDERFTDAAMEDVDLRTRLKKKGYTAGFVPAATVAHPWRRVGGWIALSQTIRAHLLFWSLHPELSASQSPLRLLLGAMRVLKRVVGEVVRYRGKGAAGAFRVVMVWLGLAIAAVYHRVAARL